MCVCRGGGGLQKEPQSEVSGECFSGDGEKFPCLQGRLFTVLPINVACIELA